MRKQSRFGALLAVSLLSATSVAGSAAFAAAPAGAQTRWSPSRSTRLASIRSRSTRYRKVVRRGAAAPATGDAWARLRACESGGNYAANTGNGYYGAYQFSLTTWRALGYSGLPSAAAPAVQDAAAQRLQASAGWGQWPACSRSLGLR